MIADFSWSYKPGAINFQIWINIYGLVIKKDAKPFKIPKNINLVLVDAETGLPSNGKSKKKNIWIF